MTATAPETFNIFSALHTAITTKDHNKLRFVKCKKCGRVTPYRIRNLPDSGLRCKKCNARISLYYSQ